jgi:formylglycine-generating enzyme required for sulfatase activity
MNERSLFLAALDIPDPAARSVYLDEVCAGNPVLRRQVEALLRSHREAGHFLEIPVAEQLGSATWDATAPLDASSGGEEVGAGRADGPISQDTQAEQRGAALDESPLDFLQPSGKPGSLGRLGHYEVLELIGRGGFGIVLKAFDENLHRVVAIKVLGRELAASGTARKRFVREAQAAAAVKNDHVVAIYNVEVEHQPPYLVMEMIDGISLQDRLDRDGPLELKEILRIGMQMAEGLAAAHKQGLIHRDIKPANILLENGVQRVKITDFGLARAVDDASVTQSGVIAGTPLYMAPEQARGDRLDHRADLFSLGSVLYTMCTGRPPFRASGTMAVLKRVCEETPQPVHELNPDIPVWLSKIIARLQAKKPEERYPSAKEVAELLGQHLAHVQQPNRALMPREDKAPAGPPVVRKDAPRRWRLWAKVALGMLVVVVAFVWGPWLSRVVRNTGYLWVSGEHAHTLQMVLSRDGQLFKHIGLTGRGGVAVELPPGDYTCEVNYDRTRWSCRIELRKYSFLSGRVEMKVTDRLAFSVGRGDYLELGVALFASPTLAPPRASAPFDADNARAHQDAWARHLGTPVELTNSIGMKLRLIPPGEFRMGSTDAEVEALSREARERGLPNWMVEEIQVEAPARQVQIEQPYYLGKYEVTVAEFRQFVEATGFQTDGERSGDGGWANHEGKWVRRPEHVWKTPGAWVASDREPVVQVSWNDAQAFCRWLSEKEEVRYAIPEEKQWEFAARAGTTRAYGVSDLKETLVRYAWTRSLERAQQPQPVGLKEPNAFGLYDMLGNAWEWCAELHPTRAGGTFRVLRGGGWHTDPLRVRPTSRGAGEPDRAWDAGVGFRVAIIGDLKASRPPAGQ